MCILQYLSSNFPHYMNVFPFSISTSRNTEFEPKNTGPASCVRYKCIR